MAKNDVPKAITETIAALRFERIPLASRLDAIDLAIENLSRVFGISGAPQPLPFRETPRRVPVNVKAVAAGDDSAASARRETLLTVIAKSDIGLTLGELRKATPKMDGKDRSNALQTLKSAGKIKRAGNAWKAA